MVTFKKTVMHWSFLPISLNSKIAIYISISLSQNSVISKYVFYNNKIYAIYQRLRHKLNKYPNWHYILGKQLFSHSDHFSRDFININIYDEISKWTNPAQKAGRQSVKISYANLNLLISYIIQLGSSSIFPIGVSVESFICIFDNDIEWLMKSVLW